MPKVLYLPQTMLCLVARPVGSHGATRLRKHLVACLYLFDHLLTKLIRKVRIKKEGEKHERGRKENGNKR